MRICELARGRRNVVAIPMGEIGLAGRVLSLREGSALAYAAVEQATAPGQLSLDAMEHLYRAARITRRTRVYGVIGNPIGHSLSPLLHNTAFQARKFDAVFVPFLVQDLRDFLQARSSRSAFPVLRSRFLTRKIFCAIWTIAIRWPRALER